MIAGVPVTDVQVDDAGVVWHTLAGPLDTHEVMCVVDWPRRLDHLQQHHGQHLLSAAFEELFALRTVSFHLGPDSSTIDLAAPAATAGQAEAAEARTNQVIWENRPVHARFVSREELAAIPLRKPPAVEGPIRVVSVPDFDHSACGGTHPNATGEVGILHIRRLERRGTETRVEFVCGGRALRDLRRKDRIVTGLSAAASVGIDEVEAAVTRLRAEHAATRKKLAQTQAALTTWVAQDLIDSTEEGGLRPVVDFVFSDREPEEVEAIAREMARRETMALLASVWEGQATLIFARPGIGPLPECGKLLKETLDQFGGRGGGGKTLAKGVLEDPARAREAVRWAAAEAGTAA
jgi:alanyl-tRNA synthetase